MEHNSFDSGSMKGFLVTGLLWICAKLTISDYAGLATIVSGCCVVFVNLPKMVNAWNKLFKKKV